MSWSGGEDCSGTGLVLVDPRVLTLCPASAVSNEDLRGSSPEAAAQVVQWVSFADSDIVPPASTWVFPTLGIMHYNKQVSLGTWKKPKAGWSQLQRVRQ